MDLQEDTSEGSKGAKEVGPDSDRSLDAVEVYTSGKNNSFSRHG